MKKGEIVKAVQEHIEPILEQVITGQLVEVVLASTDEEARAKGWPSAAVMALGMEQLREALPEGLRQYLKVVSTGG